MVARNADDWGAYKLITTKRSENRKDILGVSSANKLATSVALRAFLWSFEKFTQIE